VKQRTGWMLVLSAASLLAAFTMNAQCAGGGGTGPMEDEGDAPKMHGDRHARQGNGEGQGPGEMGKHIVRDLEESDPAAFAELQELRKTDPEAFRARMEELSKEMSEKRQAEHEAIRDLVKKLRENPSDELRAELREILSAKMKKQQERLQKQLARLDAEREKTQSRLTEQNLNLDNIESQIDKMIAGNKQGKDKNKNKNKQ